jgi:ABC-type dipeptide/oligopeptide/nickel transport system ATPase component
MVPIIGLLGRSRAGKDTAALFIMQILGQEHTHLARLSQPLKDAAQALYGFTHAQVESQSKEHIDPRYNMTPRMCIQKLCEHMMSLHGHDFFSQLLYKKYDSGGFHGKCLIIPDIRYEHDIAEIRKRGGVVFKVVRENVPCHPWENNIDGLHGDVTLYNNETPEKLQQQVEAVLNQIARSKVPS